MFIFDKGSRVQKVTEGVQFYEPDILCSSYLFSGDLEINIVIDYERPGFGVALIECDEREPDKMNNYSNLYLGKLGMNDYRVYRKRLGVQKEIYSGGGIFEPEIKNASLTFKLEGHNFSVIYHTLDSNNNPRDVSIGTTHLDKLFTVYRIGFYSNADNIIRSVNFKSMVPKHWRTSVENSMGGRISFSRDTITFENCEHDAEVEQDYIAVPAGKHYFKYRTVEVNGKNDIKGYIFPSKLNTADGDAGLEDDKKNVLNKDGSFYLKAPQEMSIKFKGKNGAVKDVAIMDNDYSSFVETDDKPYHQDGGSIRIKLTGYKKIKWRAKIDRVPEWLDYTQPCPYAIAHNGKKRFSLNDMNVSLGKYYKYVYDIKTRTLQSLEDTNAIQVITERRLEPNDQDIITIMDNMNMTMTSLEFIAQDGTSTDKVIQKTVKKYVPSSITSPIIILNSKKEPLDLSASYREVVVPHKKLVFFRRTAPFFLGENIPVNIHSIKVYGIPLEAKIDKEATSIQKAASSYIEIPYKNIEFFGNFFSVKDENLKRYAYIVAEYDSIEDFYYEFTNYERETFPGDQKEFFLTKQISKNNMDVIMYGIREGVKKHKKYFYRVPDKSAMNSIDYYADEYDVISGSFFDIGVDTGRIYLHPEIQKKYQELIIDYLKKDSYTLNYRDNVRQYELDVVSDEQKLDIHYDMNSDTMSPRYVRTQIDDLKSKYIVARKRK